MTKVRKRPTVVTRPWPEVEAEMDRDPEHAAAMAEREPWERIARALIRYRIEHNITQTELARRCGMSQPAIARLEAAEHEPKLSTLRKIAHALGGELELGLTIDGERHDLASI